MSGNCLKGGVVDYVLALGTIQINQMQPTDACVLKTQRHIQRVVAVCLADVVVTLGKAYALAVYYVYCGNYLHCCQMSRKFLRIRSPVPPLFSGWNCVA